MSYVIAGYVVSLVSLAGYAASLVIRRRCLSSNGSERRR